MNNEKISIVNERTTADIQEEIDDLIMAKKHAIDNCDGGCMSDKIIYDCNEQIAILRKEWDETFRKKEGDNTPSPNHKCVSCDIPLLGIMSNDKKGLCSECNKRGVSE